MIKRDYGPVLRRLLRRYPCVTLLGPRQCGKTTFIRTELPSWTYMDLERPSDAAPLVADPEARLGQLQGKVIFDEAQRVPELFPVLRGLIDRQRTKMGRFAILGSASPTLVRHISESLAGRTAFVDLPTFRWNEVKTDDQAAAIKSLWLRGGFPQAFLNPKDRDRGEWLEAYTRSFIERDLPALGIDVTAAQMRKLWTMLAHCNGGVWNASQLAASLAVSYHTVNRYVDILEQTFLIRKLPPYFANVGKRLVKSPKIYFRDTGLLHFFLGISSAAMLDTHPARGMSWEAFIIDQVISICQREVPSCRPYFWRTSQGHEIDLVIDLGSKKIPIEVKLHSAPTAQDAASLVQCMRDLKLTRGYLVHSGRQHYSLGNGVMALAADEILTHPRIFFGS
ncbi:MAG: ATP-binding protein [Deltaproteobacteria bacterium]|nr:ATP-binding protein [Deltaproteobacteria bacterium]